MLVAAYTGLIGGVEVPDRLVAYLRENTTDRYVRCLDWTGDPVHGPWFKEHWDLVIILEDPNGADREEP